MSCFSAVSSSCDATKHVTKLHARLCSLHFLRSCCMAPTPSHTIITRLFHFFNQHLRFHCLHISANKGLVAKLGDLAIYTVQALTFFVFFQQWWISYLNIWYVVLTLLYLKSYHLTASKSLDLSLPFILQQKRTLMRPFSSMARVARNWIC